ncbi:hypothetical protein [Gillisia sp. JM1]|uniref:hypothetical protein n=1 Tax=Gillisia sp. JM1 TaxID=1283286 RepID=UPI00041845DB|nr:hypothetical protein [Gillisia sp. JM1]
MLFELLNQISASQLPKNPNSTSTAGWGVIDSNQEEWKKEIYAEIGSRAIPEIPNAKDN